MGFMALIIAHNRVFNLKVQMFITEPDFPEIWIGATVWQFTNLFVRILFTLSKGCLKFEENDIGRGWLVPF